MSEHHDLLRFAWEAMKGRLHYDTVLNKSLSSRIHARHWSTKSWVLPLTNSVSFPIRKNQRTSHRINKWKRILRQFQNHHHCLIVVVTSPMLRITCLTSLNPSSIAFGCRQQQHLRLCFNRRWKADGNVGFYRNFGSTGAPKIDLSRHRANRHGMVI